MIHHDSRPYAQAVSEAAKVAREKLGMMVQSGVASATKVIETVQSRMIQDRVVKTPLVKLIAEPKGAPRRFSIGVNGDAEPLHTFAYGQILEDAGVPKRYAAEIENQSNGTPWGSELVAHNVNTILSHRDKQRNLVRAEGGVVRGFVSDKFKRIDSRPLLESFAEACQAADLKPYEGMVTDTKVLIRAIVPTVFEPIENEVMVFGVEWRNSDYGDGGHVLNLTMTRMWCTNLAIMETSLRQIHLGKRLADDITYSNETYRADTRANALALKDAVKHIVGGDRIHAMLEATRKAREEELPDEKDKVLNRLKKFLSAPDADKAYLAFESADVVNMPPGNNLWRLSNACSWIAQNKGTSDEKKLELQAAAGAMLPKVGTAKVVEV